MVRASRPRPSPIHHAVPAAGGGTPDAPGRVGRRERTGPWTPDLHRRLGDHRLRRGPSRRPRPGHAGAGAAGSRPAGRGADRRPSLAVGGRHRRDQGACLRHVAGHHPGREGRGPLRPPRRPARQGEGGAGSRRGDVPLPGLLAGALPDEPPKAEPKVDDKPPTDADGLRALLAGDALAEAWRVRTTADWPVARAFGARRALRWLNLSRQRLSEPRRGRPGQRLRPRPRSAQPLRDRG